MSESAMKSLSAEVADVARRVGIVRLTPIQEKAIPAGFVGSARTDSGADR
jgi:superfamily II DNA/RNA helicase